MMQAARNLIDHCGIDKTEALKMACVYPALALGMEDSIGMIKPGMTAHFIATDEKLDVVQVIF
jgi:N-acetylglucosamine-6-phosphate deacetylase